jgi:hypothetical protein
MKTQFQTSHMVTALFVAAAVAIMLGIGRWG